MTSASEIETVSRQLAAHFLLAPDWQARLGHAIQTLHRIDARTFAGGAHSPETIQGIVRRTLDILFEIAAADPLTVARLYFDLLPRVPGHPLTAAVIGALSNGAAVLNLLRGYGAELDVLKDDVGASFIALHDLEQSHGMTDGFKDAIRKAMDWACAAGPHPQGGLHRIH